MAPSSIIEHLKTLDDPRRGRVLYPASEIMLVGLCSVLSGESTYVGMEEFGKSKLDVLRLYMPFKYGIASHDTFRNFFELLNAKQFEQLFRNWMESLKGKLDDCIAIDGKELRGSAPKQSNSFIHMVSAWGHESGMVFAQESVQGRGNELWGLKELLKALKLKGVTVTLDALGCQKEIAQIISEQKGHYVISLKANQSTLLESVKKVFEGKVEPIEGEIDYKHYETLDKEHGRLEQRSYRSVSVMNLPIDIGDWKGISSVIEVKRKRSIKGKQTEETQYYISSLESEAEQAAKKIRGHWGIENQLHWVLDVAFDEDKTQNFCKEGARNIALLRRIASNLLRQHPSKTSLRNKQRRAGWSNDFLISLLRLIY